MLQNYKTRSEPTDSNKLIRWEITDGMAKIIEPTKFVRDMKCSYCSSQHGFVCSHDGINVYAWMCVEDKCIKRSSDMSKYREKKIWEREMAKKQWEGEKAMEEKKREEKKTPTWRSKFSN